MSKKKPFELPDEQCERLTRPEMAACRTIMTLVSDLEYAKEDLAKAKADSGNDRSVMIYIDDVKELVDCARERCKLCTMDGSECRQCRLYQWLETNIPLDDYGDDLICPYARRDWGGMKREKTDGSVQRLRQADHDMPRGLEYKFFVEQNELYNAEAREAKGRYALLPNIVRQIERSVKR